MTEGAPMFGSGEGPVWVTGRGYSASSDLAGTDLGSRVTFTPPRGRRSLVRFLWVSILTEVLFTHARTSLWLLEFP